jgi:hypothetical protein
MLWKDQKLSSLMPVTFWSLPTCRTKDLGMSPLWPGPGDGKETQEPGSSSRFCVFPLQVTSSFLHHYLHFP